MKTQITTSQKQTIPFTKDSFVPKAWAHLSKACIARSRIYVGLALAILTGPFAANAYCAQPYAYIVSSLAGQSVGSQNGGKKEARFDSPYGIAADANGNLYVADTNNHVIRKITPAGVVTTFAGTAGLSGTADGTGAAARFNGPYGIAVDASGNSYVADTGNNTIRKITSAGVVTTLAGTAGLTGLTDGTGAAARFRSPYGVAVGTGDTIYVADRYNHAIRKITPEGVVTTLAGSSTGQSGTADGTGSTARFKYPFGIVLDTGGNVYVADDNNQAIRKITPAGVVTTFAGTIGQSGTVDGTGAAARFFNPQGMAVDTSGNLYVGDYSNSAIRKITPDGVVTTIAGTAGLTGTVDGTGAAARFTSPSGVAVDTSGNIHVVDQASHTIRKITPTGVVTTTIGTAGLSGTADGTGAAARFKNPVGVAVDPNGNVYVAELTTHTIRKITPAGAVTTLAGTAGQSGSTDATGSVARFKNPYGVAVDQSSNVYVADYANHIIRKITPAGVVTTLAGTAGQSGTADGTGAAARFYSPSGVAVDTNGNLYIADRYNHAIRKITPAGVVTTFAGTIGQSGTADGTGAAAGFNYPFGVAVDTGGNVYVADTNNHVIRKITPAGVVTTFAGTTGQSGTADGTAYDARFTNPQGVAADTSGNLYIVDNMHTIRKITPGRVVTTIAGTAGLTGTADGRADIARFKGPYSVAVDVNGNLYVADTSNQKIRKITNTTEYGFHSADLDRNHRLSLTELLELVTIFNNQQGNLRIGAYSSTSETAFTAGNGQIDYVHKADTDLDGRINLRELTRVIELYNTTQDWIRTGEYQWGGGTEDGFAPALIQPEITSEPESGAKTF